MKTKKKTSEYDTFANLASKLLHVPHDEVKAKLNAEKEAKKQKESRKSSASREGA